MNVASCSLRVKSRAQGLSTSSSSFHALTSNALAATFGTFFMVVSQPQQHRRIDGLSLRLIFHLPYNQESTAIMATILQKLPPEASALPPDATLSRPCLRTRPRAEKARDDRSLISAFRRRSLSAAR